MQSTSFFPPKTHSWFYALPICRWPTRPVKLAHRDGFYDEPLVLTFNTMKPQPPYAPFGVHDAYAFQRALHNVKQYAQEARPYTFIASHHDYPNGKRFIMPSAVSDERLMREVVVTLIWGEDLRGVRREVALLVAAWLEELIIGLARQGRSSEIEEGSVSLAWEDSPDFCLGVLDFRIKDLVLETAVGGEPQTMRGGRS